MSPSSTFWGPSAWHFLHTLTFHYPDKPSIEEQNASEQFFLNLSKLLPCASCRQHYEKEILKNPPNTSSKTLLSSWLVDIHNRINKRLKKPIFSYESARLKYSGENSQCKSNCSGIGKVAQIKDEKNEQQISFQSGLLFFLVVSMFTIVGYYYVNYKKEIKNK
jgi:hypothetical protein